MCRTNNRWRTKGTGWQHKNYRNQCRQRTRWRSEIRAFAGVEWSPLTPDKRWRTLGNAFVLQWTTVTDDDDDYTTSALQVCSLETYRLTEASQWIIVPDGFAYDATKDNIL